MIENEGLDYHNDHKIKKHLLKMLLEDDLYNDFCIKVKEIKIPIFTKSSFYEIFPQYSYNNDDFIEIIRNKWQKYIIPQTHSHILEVYNNLGRIMEKSGMFKTLLLNVTDRDEKIAKINGIYLARKELSDGTWNTFIKQNDLGYIFDALPNIVGAHAGNDILLFSIKGFNDHLTPLRLQD